MAPVLATPGIEVIAYRRFITQIHKYTSLGDQKTNILMQQLFPFFACHSCTTSMGDIPYTRPKCLMSLGATGCIELTGVNDWAPANYATRLTFF